MKPKEFDNLSQAQKQQYLHLCMQAAHRVYEPDFKLEVPHPTAPGLSKISLNLQQLRDTIVEFRGPDDAQPVVAIAFRQRVSFFWRWKLIWFLGYFRRLFTPRRNKWRQL